MSLTCGRDSEKEGPASDVALKLTARFTDRQFLRSARISGKWLQEEASTAYFPFIPDQPFRVKTPLCIHDLFTCQATLDTPCLQEGSDLFIYWTVICVEEKYLAQTHATYHSIYS